MLFLPGVGEDPVAKVSLGSRTVLIWGLMILQRGSLASWHTAFLNPALSERYGRAFGTKGGVSPLRGVARCRLVAKRVLKYQCPQLGEL